MTTATYFGRGRRLYRQTGKHCQILISDAVYAKLQRIKDQFELKNIAQVVDLVTRSIAREEQRAYARPEGP